MKVTVIQKGVEREVDLDEGSSSFHVIRSLGLFPDGVLVFRKGKVLPEDEPLSYGDDLEIVRIASGG